MPSQPHELSHVSVLDRSEVDELDHVVCRKCSPDVALCGASMADTDWADDAAPVECVVCADLMWRHCPRCGF